MNDQTKRLADVLRGILTETGGIRSSEGYIRSGPDTARALDNAREALAAHDAQPAQDEVTQLKAEVERLTVDRDEWQQAHNTLRARIASLESGWISVEERLPALGDYVWADTGADKVLAYRSIVSGEFMLANTSDEIGVVVIQWAPVVLPAAKGGAL